MDSNTVISVKNINKVFRVYQDRAVTLKELFLNRKRKNYEEHVVLDNINFEIKKGEVVAFIGENGCGKSTLLKILAGIIYPDTGEVKVEGKVSSLLELGAGFHPDFTGRENVYNNAAILGFTKQEVDKKFNEIVDFAELWEFIDNPVRTYSSGMYMRLAFSVAINVDPDVLLIDEILSVGDSNFQRKCFEKLMLLKKKGVTILIVSHDNETIKRFCNRVFWLNKAKIKLEGNSIEVVDEYLSFLSKKYSQKHYEHKANNASDASNDEQIKHKEETQEEMQEVVQEETQETQEIIQESHSKANELRRGNGKVMLSNFKLFNSEGKEEYVIKHLEKVSIKYNYETIETVDTLNFGIAIKDVTGFVIFGTNSLIDGLPMDSNIFASTGNIKDEINELNLLPGTYTIDIAVSSILYEEYDYVIDAITFDIVDDLKYAGVSNMCVKKYIDGKDYYK